MNSNKVIFLDVDGVLNSITWFQSAEYKALRDTHKEATKNDVTRSSPGTVIDDAAFDKFRDTHIDPRALKELNRVLEITNADIVVSSTWRTTQFTMCALASCGINDWDRRFLGKTPRSWQGGCRGDEIAKWISDNNYQGQFVILDDDADMGDLMEHLVQTSVGVGLTPRESKEIIHRLS